MPVTVDEAVMLKMQLPLPEQPIAPPVPLDQLKLLPPGVGVGTVRAARTRAIVNKRRRGFHRAHRAGSRARHGNGKKLRNGRNLVAVAYLPKSQCTAK
jgi:hypothetical protein